MKTLFDGTIHVHYGFIHFTGATGGNGTSHGDMCAGQREVGLCGGQEQGVVSLVTGTHTGDITFVVELHDHEPPFDDSWEDVVEVSFRPSDEPGSLCLLPFEGGHPLDLEEAPYRVRYCVSGMDEAHEDQGERWFEGQPSLDRYLLQVWPAGPAPDRVLKQTSEMAQYWRKLTLKPYVSPEERARQKAEQTRRLEEERRWGGRAPSARMLEAADEGWALDLSRLDRDLLDALAEATPQVQRALARWAVRRAFDRVGLAGTNWVPSHHFVKAGLNDGTWIAPLLEAMDRGRELPAPFTEPAGFWHAMGYRYSGDRGLSLRFVHLSSPAASAIYALFAAGHPDPLRAAADTLAHTAFVHGEDSPAFLAEARLALPGNRSAR